MNKSFDKKMTFLSTPSSSGKYNHIREKLDRDHYIQAKKNGKPKSTADLSIEEEKTDSGSICDFKNETKEFYKQWVGRVISIENESEFIARIEPITTDDKIRIVKFNKKQLQIINSQCFEEGAVFYWTVGLLKIEGSKTMMKRSEIRFRLLPPPSRKLIEEAEERARKIFDGISWLE